MEKVFATWEKVFVTLKKCSQHKKRCSQHSQHASQHHDPTAGMFPDSNRVAEKVSDRTLAVPLNINLGGDPSQFRKSRSPLHSPSQRTQNRAVYFGTASHVMASPGRRQRGNPVTMIRTNLICQPRLPNPQFFLVPEPYRMQLAADIRARTKDLTKSQSRCG
jgi:hypothetical protein